MYHKDFTSGRARAVANSVSEPHMLCVCAKEKPLAPPDSFARLNTSSGFNCK